jgi:pantoate--beta-alanine ligase
MPDVPYPTPMSSLPLAERAAEVRSFVSKWRANNSKIALVPTMGALHEGHLAHLAHARKHAEHVVVSIFVNPTQFAPHEDFERYPRDLSGDMEKLQSVGGADLIYAPSAAELYPNGAVSKAVVDGPAAGLETIFRPHFFGGVVTVVEKLFRHVQPDFATFGEKDYQQLLVVKRLARELDMNIEILAVPIVRESDGLALSSRNAYLSRDERNIAPALNRVLHDVGARMRSGRDIAAAEAEGNAALLKAGFDSVDYCAIRDAETLQPVREFREPCRILGAAWLGKTRLIDNVAA